MRFAILRNYFVGPNFNLLHAPATEDNTFSLFARISLDAPKEEYLRALWAVWKLLAKQKVSKACVCFLEKLCARFMYQFSRGFAKVSFGIPAKRVLVHTDKCMHHTVFDFDGVEMLQMSSSVLVRFVLKQSFRFRLSLRTWLHLSFRCTQPQISPRKSALDSA